MRIGRKGSIVGKVMDWDANDFSLRRTRTAEALDPSRAWSRGPDGFAGDDRRGVGSGRIGFRVARFEFGYMASRRTSAARKPPPRAETLGTEYIAAIDALGGKKSLIIGGKSMGGRVASIIADELHASGRIAGLLCLGYPFHPIGKPDQLRTRHLTEMKTPTLSRRGRGTCSAPVTKWRPTRSRETSRSAGLKTAIKILSRARASPAFRRPIIYGR